MLSKETPLPSPEMKLLMKDIGILGLWVKSLPRILSSPLRTQIRTTHEGPCAGDWCVHTNRCNRLVVELWTSSLLEQLYQVLKLLSEYDIRFIQLIN